MLYGIKSCDTVKKAREWLDDVGVATPFRITRPPESRPQR
jgi:arsenate reductase-like glutaredoxin family protein